MRATTLVLCLAFASNAFAQSVQTSLPEAARFQIIQSSITAVNTMKLDRHSGYVWEMTVDQKGESRWQPTFRLKHSDDCGIGSTPQYQIFLSGIAARFAYLLNVKTGATWLFTRDSKTNLGFWEPIETQRFPEERPKVSE